ncbi:MAG: hypothetical protein ACC662_03695 [Planctomycetota bacterium]
MRSIHATLLVVLALTVTALPLRPAHAGLQAGPYAKNERWGFKIRAPQGWKRRAVHVKEQWIADRFYPDAPLRVRGSLEDQVAYRPDLLVVGFPHARTKRAGVHKEKIGENAWVITVENPYRDYLDFVKRESWAGGQGGGWFVSRNEEIEHAGLPVTVVEIKVEKLARAPLRIVTWVYHADDVDFAVQIRYPQDRYAADRAALENCLKSFREIPRTRPFPEAERKRPTFGEPEKERSLAEIRADLMEKVAARVDEEIESLPKGWRIKRSRHYVVISQQDAQHTQYVVNFAEAIRKYLEDHLGDIGQGYVPIGLIRVFANPSEEGTYRQGTRSWWADEVDEIVMTFSRGTDILGEFSGLGRRLTDQWLHGRNENLRNGLPAWLRYGLYAHIAWARPSKRKKMVMEPTPSAVRDLAVLFRNQAELPLKTLIQGDTKEAYGGYEHMTQAASVVHWLLTRGNRGKTKGALVTYMRSLVSIIVDEDAKFEKAQAERMKVEAEARAKEAVEDAGKSQEELEREEDEEFRQRREHRGEYGKRLAEKYKAIRTRAFEAAFGHLTDKDWAALDKRWKRFALRR